VNVNAVASDADRLFPIAVNSCDLVVCLDPPTANTVEADPFAEPMKLQFAHGLKCPHNHGGRLGHGQSLGHLRCPAKDGGHLVIGDMTRLPAGDRQVITGLT
jgi:hypothetical protein